MGILNPRSYRLTPFLYGALIGVAFVYGAFFADQNGFITGLIERAYALVDVIEPNGDGTVSGTPTGCGGTNASCLADGALDPSIPTTTSFVVLASGASDYYQMETLPSVATVTAITVHTYHAEGNANMATYVSLWDSLETTQYGTEVTLANKTSAGWDPAVFSGLSLTGDDLLGLRVRLSCIRPGGGKTADCTEYAMYGSVTYSQQTDLIVSSTGTQNDLAVGATSAHVGGAFVLSEETGSRTLSSLTIAEQGTVDALSHLDNIELWYEHAADCSTEGYGTGGAETQFGSTVTGGFSSANGTVTFGGDTHGISSADDLCLYVVLDVLAGATGGQTIELQITNPTADIGLTGGPVISPSTPVLLPGTTNLTQVNLDQIHYHWRNDDGSESAATSATGNTEDTVFTDFPRQTTYRLRMEVSNEGNSTSASTQYALEYAIKSTQCADATVWTNVGEAGGDWDMSNSAFVSDGNTTNVLLGINGAVTDENTTFVGTGALRTSTATSGAITLTSTQWTELEYSIEATSNAGDGFTYCFRVTDAGSEIDTYTIYPEASIASDLLVTGSGSQTVTVNTGTNFQYLGGSFDITDNSAGAHTLSNITIHASGTVDLQNDIDEIALYYDLDTDATADCVSESYNGNEQQYGATTTAGFSATATSTFSESLSVSPSQAVCVYVVYSVLSTATNGETLEVYMNDASTDLVIDTGSIAPAAKVDLGGYTTFVNDIVTQVHYHWRNNTGVEAAAGSETAGVEDTLYTEFPTLTTKRIRFGVHNAGGASTGNFQYQLEWAQRVSTCEAVSVWTSIDTGGDEWSVVSSALVDNADTTNVAVVDGGVTNEGTFKNTNGGQQDVDGITGNIDLAADEQVALEYAIQASGTATEGSTYCFRVSNAGISLDTYNVYAELTIKLDTDFAVYRGATTTVGTSITLVEGVDYDLQLNDPSRAFIRITNTHHTGGGPAAGSTGNHNADDVTAYISNPGNIATSVNITRFGAANDSRVAWEVVEYLGDIGGENEIVVRDANVATYGAGATTVTTGAVLGIVDDADVVPFITGQATPDTGRLNYNEVLSTSAWDAGGDTVTFTRGQTGGAVAVSYAVIEFVGSNWRIQRAEKTYTSNISATSTAINPVTISKAFVHAQHRAAGTALDTHADFGHEVWISAMAAVSFRLDGQAQTPTSHTSVAWVVENTQNVGKVMKVQQKNADLPDGGGGLTTTNVTLLNPVEDLSTASLFINNRSNELLTTFPEPIISAQLISTTQFQLQESDDGSINAYRAEVVEWPTAARKLIQNDFRLYEDNDLITPTTAWSGLAENAEMTGSDSPIALGQSIRIRMNLTVTGASMPAGVDAFKLEYAERQTTCSALLGGDWNKVGDISSTTALWRGHAGSPVDGTTLPSSLLAVSTVSASYEEESPTIFTPVLALVNDEVEFDWSIEHNGATDKADYCFRMVEANDTPLESYSTYPVIRTVGYGPVVGNWRFFDDEGSLTPSVGLGVGENSSPSAIDNDDVIKLRATLAEKSGATGTNVKFKLQYSEFADFSQVFDVASSTLCNNGQNSLLWCYADGAGVDNELIDEKVISDADACSAGVGTGCGTHNEGTSTVTATYDHTALTNAEFEFTLQNDGARTNAVYYFRLWNIGEGEAVPASSTYPSLLVASSSVTLIASGVNAGAVVDGHVIDATSTPSSISYGTLPFDTEYTAAQSFSFDLNATEGYQVLLYSDQDLTNQYGGTIPPVIATNATPLGWASACSVLLTGCFGYHSTDATLAGGSARFGAPDSFASVTTSPAEIFYTSVPGVTVHDIVYKLQVGQDQPAGEYQAGLTIIVVPQF